MSFSDFESDQKQKRLSLIIELFFNCRYLLFQYLNFVEKFFLLLYESYYYLISFLSYFSIYSIYKYV